MADRTVRVRLEAAVAGYRAQMAQAADATRQSSQRIQGHIRDNAAAYTTLGIAATAAGVAAAAGIRSVLSAGADFQASMNQVRAVSGATGAEFDALSGQARELGASTKFSASEAAEGMGFLAMAGFDASETMKAMPGVLQLAAAGAMDLGTAADIASNVLTGFGLTASDIGRVNDVMAATFTTTNTSLTQLGEAMKYVAPVAASAGLSIEETAAAIGLMGNAGIQGSMAGTSLRGAISRLLQPSKQAADLLADLGIQATNADGSLVSLDQIVEQLAASGATTGEMMLLFGQRAGPAMASLVSQGADALRDQTQVALESAGTAAQIADIQMEGLAGSLTQLKSAAEGLKISLFESGAGAAAESAVDMLTGLVRTLEGLPAPAQAAFMGATGLTALVGTFGGAALIAAPRIVSTTDAIRALGGVSGMTRGALSGLVRFGLHPVTIAIGGALTILGIYAREKAIARQRVDEFVATLDTETAAVTSNTEAWIVKSLQERGALDRARNLGISTRDVVDALLGEQDALGRVQAAIDAAAAASSEFTYISDENTEALRQKGLDAAALTNILGDLNGTVDEGIRLARDEAVAMAELEGRFLDVQHALDRGLDPAFLSAADAAGMSATDGETAGGVAADMSGEFEELADDVYTTSDAMRDLISAMRELTDPVYAVRAAHDRFKEAQEKVVEVTNDNEASQRDLEQALIDEARAAEDFDFALHELHGGMDDGVVTTEGLEQRMRYLETQYGLSSDAAKIMNQMLEDYYPLANNLPVVQAQVRDEQVRALKAELIEIEKRVQRDYSVNLTVRFQTVGFQATMSQIDRVGATAGFRGLQSTGSTASRSGVSVQLNHAGGFAGRSGSFARGPARRDEVDTRLQLGEFVLSRQMVARPDVQAILPTLHGGGPVGRVAVGQPAAMAAASARDPEEMRPIEVTQVFNDDASDRQLFRARYSLGGAMGWS